MENTSLKENGVNVGQVGTACPPTMLLQDIITAEPGFIPDVTAVRELAWDQPLEAEGALSLTHTAPLRMNRAIAENLLSHYYDSWLCHENTFKSDREPTVIAYMLLRILRYINKRKHLGLVETNWPLSPFFIRLLRMLVKRVSKLKRCNYILSLVNNMTYLVNHLFYQNPAL